MDWVTDHIQILFLVAIAVTAILQRLKKTHEGEEPPRPASTAPEEAERTRRIQEDIRRRIMERRGLDPAAPRPRDDMEEAGPFPAAPPMIEEVRPVRVEPAPVVAAADARIAAELKRQQEIVERIRQLETAKHAGSESARLRSQLRGAEASTAEFRIIEERSLPDLHSRSGLRRAIVLREVLGPPIGLR
jgi:hypothetical protein